MISRYLHKTLAPGLHEYLCTRLLSLPEADLERYLSQLSQLCISRPGTALEGVLIELCARSLRIAVKTYWLLLAISQDNPRNRHVSTLRDRCEQAALEGHWDLPFKNSKLPPLQLGLRSREIISGQTAFASANSSSTLYSCISPNNATPPRMITPPPRRHQIAGEDVRGSSPTLDEVPRLFVARSGALSPDVPPRPLSPDGLGSGIFSSVFMDAGVEGLIQEPEHHIMVDETGSPVHLQPWGGHGGDLARSIVEQGIHLRSIQENGGSGDWVHNDAGNGHVQSPSILSQSSSPRRRRETTFGATLDFVEALCMASSNLTAFSPPDRQWALQKALHSINSEIDRASAAGMAIWWPMGKSLRQRVVRLAYKESKLLNSREKAPFTLYVEVLDEIAAEAEADAQMELGPSGEDCNSTTKVTPGSVQHGTSALAPLPQQMEWDPAASAAAAAGLPWVAQHHRRSSSRDINVSLSASLGSATTSTSWFVNPGDGNDPHPLLPRSTASLPLGFPMNGNSVNKNDDSLALISQKSDSSTLATTETASFADFASDGSQSPPVRAPVTGGPRKGSQPKALYPQEGDFSPSTTLVQGGGTWIGGSYRLHAHHAAPHPATPSPKFAGHLGVMAEGSTAQHGLYNSLTAANAHSISLSDLSNRLAATLPRAHKGEAAKVTVLLHVLSASEAEDSSGRDSQLDSVSNLSTRPKNCAQTTWMCKIGLCRGCEKPDREAVPLLDPSEGRSSNGSSSPRVKVTITVNISPLDLTIPRNGIRHKRMPSHEALLHVAREHSLPPPPLTSTPPSPPEVFSEDEARRRQHAAVEVHGEDWGVRKARVRSKSPHGSRPGWDLRAVIVKSGDDCRQELLAMQLIATLHDVWTEARLPLWVRPYEVLVTSNRTALIEMVPNAPSIHVMKAGSPVGTSLRSHFAAKFIQGTPEFARAQRNFVESMAAYSLISYLLQLRDRHNGNILLDDVGHVVHIDFGFMLTNSPGGVNFESAPFKLTREMLEVMDSDPEGTPSELFDYFKVLMIQGFLAARRHSDRLCLLVEMMAGSGCPCFKNKVAAVQGVKKRCALGLPEPSVVELVLGLISDSLDAWRTRQYDYYQRVLNGIL